MTLADQGFLDLGDMRLEYRMIGPRPDAAPTIVMLHEGLGCVGIWGEFPRQSSRPRPAPACSSIRAPATASRRRRSCRARSPSCTRRRATCCRRVLDAIGFRRGLLLGHSDGASIAAIYAGSVQDHRVRGLVLMAPHFFTEDMGIAEIARAKVAFETGPLRAKLARWHADVDNAFHGWNDPWLDPEFRKWDITDALAYIRVPILIVQGENDQYGTMRQIEVAQQECYCPVEVALLPGTRHAPHREAPEATLRAIAEFANRLLRDHHEGDIAAHTESGSARARSL